MISIKLFLVLIVLVIILYSFLKNVKRNEESIKILVKECDSIHLEIDQLEISKNTNSGTDITKFNTLRREKAILIDKLIDHGHFYKYVPNRKQ